MDIMNGLSVWLRQVIAVLLLASLIDLLLPNKTMQRYVRLVAGLFILLTVASPIIQWVKGDFGSQLAQGLQSVEQSPEGAGRQLAMIKADGAKLRDRKAAQAAELAAARLESEIGKEVEQAEGRSVRRVSVGLEKVTDGSLAVVQVMIELEPEAPGRPSGRGGGAHAEEIREVEAVADVEIEVGVGGEKASTEEGDRAVIANEAGAERELDKGVRTKVIALVANRFGIAPGIVEVKLPDEERAVRRD